MKALFLDIDGVLQPHSSKERFSHIDEMKQIVEQLNVSHPAGQDWKEFAKMGGQYDIAAVMFDWDQPSVERLRNVLDTTGAKIVLSTDWRYKGEPMMKALLSLHGLDKYYYDSTYYVKDYYLPLDAPDYERRSEVAEENRMEYRMLLRHLQSAFDKVYPPVQEPDSWYAKHVDSRAVEIREYLDRHPEITAYVTIDDRDLCYGLDGHAVVTRHDQLTEEEDQACIEILSKEDGPYALSDACRTEELLAWREKWLSV